MEADPVNASLLWTLGGSGLLLAGLWAFVLRESLLRKILAFNVMGSGAFLMLMGFAQQADTDRTMPEILVITGIVVAVSATALGLRLLRQWYRLSGRTDLPHGS